MNALRQLLRRALAAPGYSLTIVATLAIGIGAATTMFGVVNSVLLKPLPYPEADRLVSIWHDAPGAPGLATVSGGLRPSLSMYMTYADENTSFESIGLWERRTVTVTGFDRPEELAAIAVTDGVFQALDVRPEIGRWIGARDMELGAAFGVVISYGYWQRRFGRSPSVVGRSIDVNGGPAEIVGVMPAGFRIADEAADIFAPIRFDRSTLSLPPFCCQVTARLKPGVTIDEANADVERMLSIWVNAWPFDGNAQGYLDVWQISPALRFLKDDVTGNVSNLLWVVMAAIAAVLLIASMNVASLMLVRSEGRRQEFAVRAALGAGRLRIGKGFVLEAVAFAIAGGLAGIMLAQLALALLLKLDPANLPRIDEIALDAATVGFALVIASVLGLVLGLVMTLRQARSNPTAAIRSGGRSATTGRERHRAQNILVVTQVALSLVLLIGAGLMLRTISALGAVEPGFSDPATLQTLRITIPGLTIQDPLEIARLENDIVEAVAAIPFIDSVAISDSVPLDGGYRNWDSVEFEGEVRDASSGVRPLRTFKYVSPGYFSTLGTPLLTGRDISWTDVHEQRPIAIVSEQLASELWGSPEAALGQRIRVGGGDETTPWRDVIGVAGNVRENGLSQPPATTAYFPPVVANFYRSSPWYFVRTFTVTIRSRMAGSLPLIDSVQQAVSQVHPDLPIAALRTMSDIYDDSLARVSFVLVLIAISASVAIGLGMVGLYGVLAYTMAQRRREVAVRLALGARYSTVIGQFVRTGLTLAGIGVAVGLIVAANVTGYLDTLLFGVEPYDPATFLVVPLLLFGVAAIASYIPARRVSHVAPAEALSE